MSPQEIEAAVQQILSSAALVEGEAEAAGECDALQAALAVEAVLREVSGGSTPTAAPADADPESDEAWFAANPGRTARLRPHRPEERRPAWAEAGEPLMAVVRYFWCLGSPRAEVYPAEAFAGEPVADTDEAVLAAVRSARGLR